MPKRKDGELPRIIKQAGKAVDDDLKPTIHVLGRLLFGAWPAKPPPPPTQERGVPRARRLPPLRVNVESREVARTNPAPKREPPLPPLSDVADAEIVEISTNCPTCGGSGMLGRPGYEVRCPFCNP